MARDVVSSYLELGGEEHAERDSDHPAHHCHKPEDEGNPAKIKILLIGICGLSVEFCRFLIPHPGKVDPDSRPYPTSLT
jgi:hypothetical protein